MSTPAYAETEIQQTETERLVLLMQRIAKRDRQAFAELYLATSAKLLGVLLRIMKDRARAEDILQDVFVKVWERADDFNAARGAPMGWLVTMARNKALDELRRRVRVVSSETVPEFDEIAAETSDPLEKREQKEAGALLARCLAGLEQMKKEMIVLAYQRGMSREELAQRYNAPVATIKTWLRRSLENLRMCLSTNV